MKTRIAVIVLWGLAVVSCAGSPDYGQTSHASFVAPQLGIVADGDLRIIEIQPESAAEKAGLQLGDILLDLTWIPSDAPAYLPESSDIVYPDTIIAPVDGEGVADTAAGEAFTSPIFPAAATPIPPPVASYIEKGTVLFTESSRIKSLVVYGVPLKLRLMRGDEVLELTIVPTVPPTRSFAPNEPRGTFTPVMSPYYYY
jgi:hypothetical protein